MMRACVDLSLACARSGQHNAHLRPCLRVCPLSIMPWSTRPRPAGFWTRDCTQTDSGCAAQRGEMPGMSCKDGIRVARAMRLRSHADAS